MSAERPPQGLLDTNVVILRRWIDPAELPDEMAISAITLAELSAGPHAATAMAEQLPLFTVNPDDFNGLDGLVTIVPVTRPHAPHER